MKIFRPLNGIVAALVLSASVLFGQQPATSIVDLAIGYLPSLQLGLSGSKLPLCETNGVIYAGTNTAGVLACP